MGIGCRCDAGGEDDGELAIREVIDLDEGAGSAVSNETEVDALSGGWGAVGDPRDIDGGAGVDDAEAEGGVVGDEHGSVEDIAEEMVGVAEGC